MVQLSSKQRRGRSSLLDQVAHESALAAAFADVRRAGGQAGVDGVGLDAFEADLDERVAELSLELRAGWYKPLPVRRVRIPKPDGRERVIGIPVIRARVVARACQKVLNRRLDRVFRAGSFAYRPGRSCRGAINRLLRYIREGKRYVAVMDVADFFPSVDRKLLEAFLHELFPGDPIVPLLLVVAAPPALERGVPVWSPRGIEQGSAVSPLLANVYLHPWDNALDDDGACWVRYSDNAVVACSSPAEAERVLEESRTRLDRLGLSLNPTKSAVYDADDGLAFLGYHITTRGVGPELKAVERLAQRLQTAAREDAGHDLEARLARRRTMVFGWVNYYRTLEGVVMPDPWSFVAALQVAARRNDRQGARYLLRRPLPDGWGPGSIPETLLERAREALDRLEMASIASGEAEEVAAGTPGKTGADLDQRTAELVGSVEEVGAAAEPAGTDPCRPGKPAPPAAGDVPWQARGPARCSSRQTQQVAGDRGDVPADPTDITARCEALVARGAYREALRLMEQGPSADGVAGTGAAPVRPVASPPPSIPAPVASPVDAAPRQARGLTGAGIDGGRLAALRAEPGLGDRDGGLASDPDHGPLFRVSASGLVRLMALFRGAPDLHARMWVDRRGRRGYAPQRGPLDEAAWRRHLEGEVTCAIYLFDQGRLHVAVLDVDIAEPGFSRIKDHPDALLRAMAAAHDYAVALVQAAARRGVTTVLEASGQKGRHVWFFFDPPAKPRDALALLKAVRSDAGPPPEGIHCENLPAGSRPPVGSGGPLVTAPLGIHLQSGRRSVFLETDGEVVTDVGSVLAGIRPAPGDRLRALIDGGAARDEEQVPIGDGNTQIEAVLEGCPVMRRLVDKAGAIHHLAHMERMAILYVMGHFGEEGKAFVHRVMARCANYDRHKTQAYVEKLKPSPVGCKRLGEWLPEVMAEACRGCTFDVPRGAYPTPVLHALGRGR